MFGFVFAAVSIAAFFALVWFVAGCFFVYSDARSDAEAEAAVSERYPGWNAYKNTYAGLRAGLYDLGFRHGMRAYGRIAENRDRFRRD